MTLHIEATLSIDVTPREVNGKSKLPQHDSLKKEPLEKLTVIFLTLRI